MQNFIQVLLNVLSTKMTDKVMKDPDKNHNKELGEGNCEQMSFNHGQKIFDKRIVASMFKEYNPMEDMAVLAMIKLDSLTTEQNRKALQAVNLIKQKRNCIKKGRMCEKKLLTESLYQGIRNNHLLSHWRH